MVWLGRWSRTRISPVRDVIIGGSAVLPVSIRKTENASATYNALCYFEYDGLSAFTYERPLTRSKYISYLWRPQVSCSYSPKSEVRKRRHRMTPIADHI